MAVADGELRGLRAVREATVREHMSAENEHQFDRCIAAFGHPRYEIMATGEVWDGSDGVKTFLLENKEPSRTSHSSPRPGITRRTPWSWKVASEAPITTTGAGSRPPGARSTFH
jgi:hypothetical protein